MLLPPPSLFGLVPVPGAPGPDLALPSVLALAALLGAGGLAAIGWSVRLFRHNRDVARIR